MSEALRRATVADLEEYRAEGEQEQLRVLMLDFLAAHPRAFERDNPSGRFTASAVVVDPRTRGVLLHHSRKLGRWVQLGGHCEDDATLLGAALRESREESGLGGLRPHSGILDLEIYSFTSDNNLPGLILDVRYMVTGDSTLSLTVSPEAWELRWWPLEHLPAETSVQRAAQKAVRRLGP